MNRAERRKKKSKRDLKVEQKNKELEVIRSLDDHKVYTLSDESLCINTTLPGLQIKRIYGVL